MHSTYFSLFVNLYLKFGAQIIEAFVSSCSCGSVGSSVRLLTARSLVRAQPGAFFFYTRRLRTLPDPLVRCVFFFCADSHNYSLKPSRRPSLKRAWWCASGGTRARRRAAAPVIRGRSACGPTRPPLRRHAVVCERRVTVAVAVAVTVASQPAVVDVVGVGVIVALTPHSAS